MKLPLRSLFLISLLTISASAQTLFTYTATGSLISGSLNGTSFTDANWVATATADPNTRVYHEGEAPSWEMAAPLSLTITDDSNTFTVELSDWTIFSVDYTAYFGGSAHGASGFYSSGGAIYLDDAAGYIDLNTPTTLSGTSGFDDNGHNPYATSGGDLIITDSSHQQPGTFVVSAAPVPEPSTWSALAGAGALGIGCYFRRKRQQKT